MHYYYFIEISGRIEGKAKRLFGIYICDKRMKQFNSFIVGFMHSHTLQSFLKKKNPVVKDRVFLNVLKSVGGEDFFFLLPHNSEEIYIFHKITQFRRYTIVVQHVLKDNESRRQLAPLTDFYIFPE